jgi:F-type H+-transporting ATPase subunit b
VSHRAAILLLAVPALARASEATHAEPHGVPWATLAFSAVNLALFVALVYRTAWPNVRRWVHERRAQIEQTLAQAAAAKREAEALRAECERRLASLDTELRALRAQVQADLAHERERLLAAAQAAAAAIRRDAERQAAQEVRDAQARLREAVARQALEMACELARQRLTAADQEGFLREFVTQVRT